MSFQNIAEIIKPNQDEMHRQRFVSILRKKVLMDFASDMKTVYENKVEPKFEKEYGRKPSDGKEIRKLMLDEPIFKAWSSLRYNAQMMTWWSVQSSIERNLNKLVEAATQVLNNKPTGGSLELNAKTQIPKEITELDIHLMPGCFHNEYLPNDVAQGALYHYGTTVFSGGLPHRKDSKGGVARSIANYLDIKYPKWKPKRILDLGCTAGANTKPYAEVFKNADVHGIDVGAPLLRFGHAHAETENIKIHYHQRNALNSGFPDEHFDLITSSFFFHEVSVKDTEKIILECYRMLKPNGLMLHMELPPSDFTDAYYNFYLDWDAYYNNEPHYLKFRELDFNKLLTKSGFKKDKIEMIRIPNYDTTPESEFCSVARGEESFRRDHGNGAVWFTFGGWK
tara:strand:+ start:547 stop:1731 length:1185 start_codon:yes stop_codon:yes gene_type:complete